MIFHDRRHAGQLLARKLQHYKKENLIILALPRGGVPIASEIADALNAPLDVLVVRKIGAPFQSELAVGAVCEEADPIWNNAILYQSGLEPDDLGESVAAERKKVEKQISLFRDSKKLQVVTQKVVIVVDDGLATGATMWAAVRYLKKKGVAKLIVAVPIAATSSVKMLKSKVDDFVTIEEREDLTSVGQWYQNFSQVTDEEVVELLCHPSSINN